MFEFIEQRIESRDVVLYIYHLKEINQADYCPLTFMTEQQKFDLYALQQRRIR